MLFKTIDDVKLENFFKNYFKQEEMNDFDMKALYAIMGKEYKPCYGSGRMFRSAEMRIHVQELGLYCKIHEPFVKKLADYIDDWFFKANIVEVGAGRGFLSAALSRHLHDDQKLTATDPFIGYNMADKSLPILHDIYQMGAAEAIRTFASDKSRYNVVLVAWPPYSTNGEFNVMNEILDTVIELQKEGVMIFIIYIGESYGGCTGEESFWKRNEYSMYELDVDYNNSPDVMEALHDRVYEIVL